jgi:hypothetical protein
MIKAVQARQRVPVRTVGFSGATAWAQLSGASGLAAMLDPWLTLQCAASILREQIRHSEGQLADLARSIAKLAVVAPRTGRILPADAPDLAGRFQRKGDVIGYVVGDEGPMIRVFAAQGDIDLVNRRTVATQVRLASDKAASCCSIRRAASG